MQNYENVSTPRANPLQAKTVFGATQTLNLWNPLDGHDKEIPAHSFEIQPGHRPGQVSGSRVRWVDPG